MRDGPVLIAGAGIAGLTAALALSARGISVRVYERATAFEQVGAGIQLSPNATRILFGLGLHEPLLAAAVRPEAVVLRDAATLRQLASVRLGAWGEQRWGAPYLVLHRATLHRVLLDAATSDERIAIATGATAQMARQDGPGLLLSGNGEGNEAGGGLIVAADGVGSALRRSPATSTGLTAWRAQIPPDAVRAMPAETGLRDEMVAAFLHARAHLVAYPMRDGSFNLVGIAPSTGKAGDDADRLGFLRAFDTAAEPLRNLVRAQAWTAWPILTVKPAASKFAPGPGVVAIGDAAHAMTPFAAQGAAMAIEDAVTLAMAVSPPGEEQQALSGWAAARSERVKRVARRGWLNGLAWHAAGPVALARNLFLETRSPERLAADLDWLYGWDASSGGR